MKRLLLVLTALVLPVLVACGQKASTREGAVTPAPVESGPALATTESAAHCRRGETVWVNSRSHIFHLPGDRTTDTRRQADICAEMRRCATDTGKRKNNVDRALRDLRFSAHGRCFTRGCARKTCYAPACVLPYSKVRP